MEINIRYSVRTNNYKFSKLDNGIPFNFCYIEVNNSNSYNFKYDTREEGTKTEKEKVVYLEKLPKEITLTTKDKILSIVNDTREISKTNNSKLLYKNYSNDIDITNSPKMLYRIDNKKEIDIFNNPLMFYRINKRDVNIAKDPLMLYRINKRNINIYNNPILIYRQNKRDISVLNTVNNLEYNNLKEMLTKKFMDNLILDNFKFINKTSYLELKKIRKQFTKPNYFELFKVPKNIVVKDPLQLNKIPKGIILDNPLFLDENSKDIYVLKDIKYLEIYKRLWWLNSTNPKDKLAIPMDDYVYNSKQLFNNYYEYLRFNTHPIAWGDTWGIDCNVPPSPVSIEIMLDLTNIITMLWHTNWTSWNSVTGKEAIQFLMELIYNWYTMNTSKTNEDYYRAYRWIRWESEKVYFLAKDDIQNNGAKYIGILVSNLIDYLKIHHFDIVPIQENIMRMGSIRINNQQGNLIKDLDKEKGSRFYYIETQNLRK